MDGLLGGPKGMLPPPSQIIRGPGPPAPPLFLRLCVSAGNVFATSNVTVATADVIIRVIYLSASELVTVFILS